uniref:Uncharacterized protein n=1 Tax=Rhizophagus irregularis (strain DAOM 181602 / DAOM 197198 / MUCL 43194) TaxID=747089 RepID=U9T0M5_RHIID
MCFSLNCLLLGEKSRNSISVIIAEGISVPDNNNNNNSYIVKHNDILVSHFMSIVFKRKSDKLNSLNSDSLELWVKRLKLTKINLKDFLQMTLKMILEASVWSRYLLNKYFTKKNFDKMKSRRRQFTSSYKCPLKRLI